MAEGSVGRLIAAFSKFIWESPPKRSRLICDVGELTGVDSSGGGDPGVDGRFAIDSHENALWIK